MFSLLRRSRGGIHPQDQKDFARTEPLWNAPVPPRCVVPLLQHAGNPAHPAVRVGERVREGVLIGRAASGVSANVHAPVPGVVSERISMTLEDGRRCEAFVIELSGEFDRLGKRLEPNEWERKSPRALLSTIRDCGVVGMGWHGMPVDRKYSVRRGTSIDHLIINGVETEPYVCADYRLMLEMTDGLLEGARIAQRILRPERVTIAVQAHRPDVHSRLRRLVRERGLGFSVQSVPVLYPLGNETLLTHAVTGREVPGGATPADVGVIVSNVATVHAIYEAVVYDKPVVERVLTVAGGAVRRPANVKARIGTPVQDLIAECGGLIRSPEKIVLGGPMMGHAISDLTLPVTKRTTAILALTPEEIYRSPRTACIRCGRCVQACPVGLEPTTLYKMLDHGEREAAVAAGLLECIECGCCGFTCPAHLPLVETLKQGKYATIRRTGTA